MTAPDLFRTRDHVAGFDAYVELFARRSAAARQRCVVRLDIAYGEAPGETLDLFFPKADVADAPIHLFVHGGYWRMFDKADFSFVAETVTQAGGIAAIVNYALMPTVRMETIIDQVRRAALWLAGQAPSLGGDPERFTVSGHSAGGQLVCWLMSADSPVQPRAALALSGLYDLDPLRHSFLQKEIGLTEDEVARFSPVNGRFPAGVPMLLMVGSKETAPFHEQARRMQGVLDAAGALPVLTSVPDADHMSIVLDLGDRETLAGRALAEMIAVSGS